MNTPKVGEIIIINLNNENLKITVFRAVERNKNEHGSNGFLLCEHGRIGWVTKGKTTFYKQLIEEDYWFEFEEFVQTIEKSE